MNIATIMGYVTDQLRHNQELRQLIRGLVSPPEPPWPGNFPHGFGRAPDGSVCFGPSPAPPEAETFPAIAEWTEKGFIYHPIKAYIDMNGVSQKPWYSSFYEVETTGPLPDKITVKDAQGNTIMSNNWPTYPEMVRNLFKEDTPANMLIHAAIGLAGETGELRAAVDRKEAIEEGGDITFYMEALRQRLPQNRGNMELLSEVVDSPYYKPNHATAVDNIHIISCQILDYCKKHWVYGKPLEEFTIAWHLELLEIQINYYCVEMLGLTPEQVKYQNQAKLMKRYDAGKYSNEAAIARKDKQ